MLTFRPLAPAAGSGGPAASPRSSAGGRRAEPGRPAQAAGGSKPAAAPDRAGAGADWEGIVAALDLQGPAGQLAAHCLLLERKPGFVRLGLDAAGEVYRRPQLEQKLCDALSAHFGEPVRLEIAAGPSEADTPARRQSQAAEQRLKDATRAIDEDPAVRAMRDVFNATVQPGSVKPL
jgi:DNA polymerase-3 subunit gamma/tau